MTGLERSLKRCAGFHCVRFPKRSRTAAQVDANRSARSVLPVPPRPMAWLFLGTRSRTTSRATAGRVEIGLLADDPARLLRFANADVAPRSAQEEAEALTIAALYVRRGRLVEPRDAGVDARHPGQHAAPKAPGGPERIGQHK